MNTTKPFTLIYSGEEGLAGQAISDHVPTLPLFGRRVLGYGHTNSESEFVLYGSSHWIVDQSDKVNKINSRPGGPKSYLRQLMIASPVIQTKQIEEPQTAVLPLLGFISVAY